MKTLGALVVLSLSLGGTAEELPRLRMVFIPGTLYRYDISTTMKTSVHVEGMEQQTTTQTTHYRLAQRVAEVDEKGNGVVETRIESLRVVGEMGEFGNVFYDSTLPSDGANPVADVYAGMVNKPFRVTTTPRGQVVKVEGLEKLFEGFEKGEAAEFDISSLLTTLLGDESWSALLQSAQPLLPETPARSWETKTETPLPLFGKVKVASRYEILDRPVVEGFPTVQVGFQTASVATPEPSSQMLGVVRMRAHLKDLQAKGTYELGAEDGWAITSKTLQTMSLKLEIDAPGLSAGAASVDFSTETTTTVKRLPNETKEKP